MNIMKIGILTLHSGANYGGTLQCIALYNLLKNNGHIVEVIDFKPTLTASWFKRLLYNISSVRCIGDLEKLFRKKTESCKVLNKNLTSVFDEYRQNELRFSASCNELSISKVAGGYDIIVVGSDQVWSSTVRTHLTYMGDWIPMFHGKLYSYAACAVTRKYPIIRKSKIRHLLDKFEVLSVRDKSSKEFVCDFLLSREVRIDLDPTLLYSFENTLPTFEDKESYILVYVLGKEMQEGNKIAIDMIKKNVGEVKVLAITIYDEDVTYADTTIKNATPTQWLAYIKNACFVFTDSFHGEVFSILFKKRFYVYYVEENRASRIIDLSKLFHVEDRVVTETKKMNIHVMSEISFSDYEKMKQESLNYINSIGK